MRFSRGNSYLYLNPLHGSEDAREKSSLSPFCEAIAFLAGARRREITMLYPLCVPSPLRFSKTRGASENPRYVADHRDFEINCYSTYTYVMYGGMFKSSEYKGEDLTLEKRYGCEIENSKQTQEPFYGLNATTKSIFPRPIG